MDILRKTALFSSFFIFNIVSSTFPINQTDVYLKPNKIPRLEENKSGKNLVIMGIKKEEVPQERSVISACRKNFRHQSNGLATYYADYFHGGRTASGEIFDMESMTAAASPEYNFGTILRVTNTVNGRSVEVKVNDRGAFTSFGVALDLSKGAFEKIAPLSQGVILVKIEVLEK